MILSTVILFMVFAIGFGMFVVVVSGAWGIEKEWHIENKTGKTNLEIWLRLIPWGG